MYPLTISAAVALVSPVLAPTWADAVARANVRLNRELEDLTLELLERLYKAGRSVPEAAMINWGPKLTTTAQAQELLTYAGPGIRRQREIELRCKAETKLHDLFQRLLYGEPVSQAEWQTAAERWQSLALVDLPNPIPRIWATETKALARQNETLLDLNRRLRAAAARPGAEPPRR